MKHHFVYDPIPTPMGGVPNPIQLSLEPQLNQIYAVLQ